ncbi:Lrp/AsnC family transcriptional regulator [Chroococcidiopsis sp.]|uniref:Lrp/AsnC family transcriptional regulator n=1 Tax=Chroococcidiopsis sp. TaxID=3088168 RepID=UPI003F31DB67
MSFDSEKLLDVTGWQILQVLQKDARLSFVELGRRVGLSPPAAAERVRRMEEVGIITGYRVEIDAAKIGLPLTDKQQPQSCFLHQSKEQGVVISDQ